MFALRQIIENPGDFMPVPAEARHRRTEVIFLIHDSAPQESAKPTLASLAGSWEGPLEREPQGEPEERLEFDGDKRGNFALTVQSKPDLE